MPLRQVIEPFSGVKLRNSLKFCLNENAEMILESVESVLDVEVNRNEEMMANVMKNAVVRLKNWNI